MELSKSLVHTVMGSGMASTAEKLRSMAKDPRASRQKREEWLDKADQADLISTRNEAANREFRNDREKQDFIEKKTRDAQRKSQELRRYLRHHYDDD